LCCVFKIL